ncbi:MAG: hypothetical protein ACP5P1_14875 [Acidimicrobiales bacterium]
MAVRRLGGFYRRGSGRPLRLFGVALVAGVVVAGGSWWFGWLGGPSPSFFVHSKIPAATGIYAPTAVDQARAKAVAAIVGGDYRVVSVSRVYAYNAPPGAPKTTTTAPGPASPAWGTVVVLDSPSTRLDIAWIPSDPATPGVSYEHVLPMGAGRQGVIRVGAPGEVSFTYSYIKPGSALPASRLTTLANQLWAYYTATPSTQTN